jgi:hypothetical protein
MNGQPGNQWPVGFLVLSNPRVAPSMDFGSSTVAYAFAITASPKRVSEKGRRGVVEARRSSNEDHRYRKLLIVCSTHHTTLGTLAQLEHCFLLAELTATFVEVDG